MKCSIWKFPLEVVDHQTVQVPSGSLVLSVAEQDNGIVLYTMVDTEIAGKELLTVYIYGTGHPIDTEDADRWSPRNRFLGTVKLHDGALMFHVFVEN